MENFGEEWEYRDEGCEVFPSCLNCPLPRCLEEEPRGRQKLRGMVRASRMAELKKQGKSTEEIALLFGVSPRTVRRALRALNTPSGIASVAQPKSQAISPDGDPGKKGPQEIQDFLG